MRIESYNNWKSGKFSNMSENVRVTQKDVEGLGGKVKFKSEGDNTFSIIIRRGEKVLSANGMLNPGSDAKLITFLTANGIYDSGYLANKAIVYQGEVKGDWRVQKIGAEIVDANASAGIQGGSMISAAEYGKATSAASLATVTPAEEQEAEQEDQTAPASNTELVALKPVFDLVSPSLPISVGDGYKTAKEKKDAIKKIQAILNLTFQKGLKIDGSFGPLTRKAAAEAIIATGKVGVTVDQITQLSAEDFSSLLKKSEETGITVDKIDSTINAISGGSSPVASAPTVVDSPSGGYNFIW